MAGKFLTAFSPLVRVMPEVKPPDREVSFKEKLIFTAVVLIIFLIMSNIPLYGTAKTEGTDYFFWWRVLLASNRGTLMELGIGPIVTAGLIMQMLAGSKLIGVDFNDPEDRVLFTGAQKAMAVILTVVQIIAYIAAGAYGELNFPNALLIFIQLLVAGIVVILMDELLQKGWGLGSGVSLFIAAGVCMNIIWGMFAYTMGDDNLPLGVIIALIYVIANGAQGTSFTSANWPPGDTGTSFTAPWNINLIAFQRPYNPYASLQANLQYFNPNLPTLLGLVATIVVFIVVIWLESVRVEIPLQYVKYRGFKGKYPIKLLYVSNIPVILVQALYANVSFFGQLIYTGASTLGQNNLIFQIIRLFADYDLTTAGSSPFLEPNPGCLIYYLTPPRGLDYLFLDPLRAIIYVAILVVLCVWFARVWIDVSGIAPRDVSHQILRSGLSIPGFRPNARVLEKILDRYIPTVTIIGGILVGLIAGFADMFGALGTGMGILLTCGIIYQYYQIIAQEQMADMNPAMRGLLGLD